MAAPPPPSDAARDEVIAAGGRGGGGGDGGGGGGEWVQVLRFSMAQMPTYKKQLQVPDAPHLQQSHLPKKQHLTARGQAPTWQPHS